MKHGRLIIAALVGAMLITSLAGCGSKGTNDGESGEYQKINLSMVQMYKEFKAEEDK